MRALIIVAASVCAAGLFLGSTPAKAQASSVESQFRAIEEELFLTATSRHEEDIAQGAQTAVFFQVEPGREVMVVGVCDEQCSDINLYVRDPNGNEVGRDVGADDVPVVVIPAGRGGQYTFQIEMARCSGRCHWGVRVY